METTAINNGAGSSSLVSQLGGSAVDQEAFLNLLVTQLRNQDPFEPVENEQFLTQLATFTQLEETQAQGRTLNSLLQTTTAQLTLGGLSQGAALVGRHITWVDPITGATNSGVVDRVTFDENGVQVRVGQQTIPAGYISGISSGPVAQDPATTPTAPNTQTPPTNSNNPPSGSGNPGNGSGGAAATPPSSETRPIIPEIEQMLSNAAAQAGARRPF